MREATALKIITGKPIERRSPESLAINGITIL